MTEMVTSTAREYDAHDVSGAAFWDRTFQERDHTFAKLRATPGLSWQQPTESIFPHEETGFWAVTRHADIRYLSVHPELFRSSDGISMDPMPAEIQRTTSFFLTMDPPDHTRYRKLISMAFTPKQVRSIEAQIRANAATVVDDFLAELESGKTIDFVDTVSRKLPMRTVSEMIGIAPADHDVVAYAAESLFGTSDDEYTGFEERAGHLMAQLGILKQAGIDLARLRRAEPRDDLMTNIVRAEVDGHRLTDDEAGSFMVLLASAGNDTTKQTTTHAFKALVENPEQRAWLLDDFDERIAGAIEEFVRWSTPVVTFARHAVSDTEVAGTAIKAGDKLVMFYCSGNFDESVFEEPGRFDLSRFPNPHIAFGGGGPHFCLGRQLATMELKHLFRELLTRVPDVDLGEAEYIHSDFVHGIKRMPVSVKPQGQKWLSTSSPAAPNAGTSSTGPGTQGKSGS